MLPRVPFNTMDLHIEEQIRVNDSEANTALLRLTIKMSTDLNVHKTKHLLLQKNNVKLFHNDINLVLNETAQ